MELDGGERSAVCCFEVSHVLSCLERKKKTAGMEEECGMRGAEQKVQNLIILGLVYLAQCLTNLSHLLRVYTGGE